MWLMGLSENPYVNNVVVFILLKIKQIWFPALIATAVLTALFVIITLAQIEAGRQVKFKWPMLTFCSLALVAGLIILKPRVNMEQVQYMPTPAPVQENIVKPNDAATIKSAPKTTVPTTGQTGAEKSQGAAGNTQGTQGQAKTEKNQAQKEGKGTSGQSQGAPSIQDQLSSSLQKKNSKDGKVEYKDPVLEEILEQKRQAEESKESASEESPAQEFSDAGALDPVDQENSAPDKKDSKELEQQTQSLKVVKARVLVSSLNVRDKGDLDGSVIGSLNTGDIVEVVDKNEAGEWIKIKLGTGQVGWVLKKYIQMLP